MFFLHSDRLPLKCVAGLATKCPGKRKVLATKTWVQLDKNDGDAHPSAKTVATSTFMAQSSVSAVHSRRTIHSIRRGMRKHHFTKFFMADTINPFGIHTSKATWDPPTDPVLIKPCMEKAEEHQKQAVIKGITDKGNNHAHITYKYIVDRYDIGRKGQVPRESSSIEFENVGSLKGHFLNHSGHHRLPEETLCQLPKNGPKTNWRH